jgi:hypothetical protein
VPSVDPLPLFGVTVRRALVLGRIFLLLALGYLVILFVVISNDTGAAYAAGVALLLPVFAVVGALGGLSVFTSDRLKGVFEYLIAYGISPHRLFVNVLAASLVLATIVLGTSLGIGLSVHLARGHTLSIVLAIFLGLYALPMSYASVAFTAMVGMYWTSLSSPRQGISSPIGMMPAVGIAPSVITLAVAGTTAAVYGTQYILVVTSIAVVLLVVVVLVLLSLVGRLMPGERLLSAM